MKKLLFVFATILFVACGNKVASPEPVEEDNLSINLPEYTRLSTEVPNISSNGYISPGQNLVYNIEIEHPLPKDSLCRNKQNHCSCLSKRHTNTRNALRVNESNWREKRYFYQ